MFYKLIIVLLFSFIGQSIFAQEVILQKNGTTKTYQFSLPKRITFAEANKDEQLNSR